MFDKHRPATETWVKCKLQKKKKICIRKESQILREQSTFPQISFKNLYIHKIIMIKSLWMAGLWTMTTTEHEKIV